MLVYDGIAMKPYGPRNVLAVLRGIIDFGQKELAEMVDRSVRTIQAIEINRLPLSDELAHRLSYETSVSLKWLLDGDISVRPVVQGSNSIPYTKTHFERTQALIGAKKEPTVLGVLGEQAVEAERGKEALEDLRAVEVAGSNTWPVELLVEIEKLLAAIHAAVHVGRAELAVYRVRKMVHEIMNEFGQKFDSEYPKVCLEFFKDGVEAMEIETRMQNGRTSSDLEADDVLWSPYLEPEKWIPPNRRSWRETTRLGPETGDPVEDKKKLLKAGHFSARVPLKDPTRRPFLKRKDGNKPTRQSRGDSATETPR